MINSILLTANLQIDFILPTCGSIPDVMWIAAGRMVSTTCGYASKIIGVSFLTNLLFGGFFDSTTKGRIDVMGLVRLVIKTIGLFLFITYIKKIVFTWEIFIDDLCPRLSEVIAGFQSDDKFEFNGGFSGIPSVVWMLVKALFTIVKEGLFFLTIGGAITAINLFKAIQLICLCIAGPISAALSLFPLFSKAFSLWMRAYINVSFQTFTLEIFSNLVAAASMVDIIKGEASISNFAISIIMTYAILKTSSYTSMFINSVMPPEHTADMVQMASKIGRSLGQKMLPGLRQVLGMLKK